MQRSQSQPDHTATLHSVFAFVLNHQLHLRIILERLLLGRLILELQGQYDAFSPNICSTLHRRRNDFRFLSLPFDVGAIQAEILIAFFDKFLRQLTRSRIAVDYFGNSKR